MLLSYEETIRRLEEGLKAEIDTFIRNNAKTSFKGTTCVAIVNQKGVIVATDGRATMGSLIGTEEFNKIFQLDQHSLLLVSGSAGLAQHLAKVLTVNFSHESDRYEGIYIPPKTKVNQIQHLLRGIHEPEILMPIFATFDTDKNDQGGRVFMIWPDGTLSPETQVAVVGSGMISAQSTVETFLEVIGLSPQKFDLRKALPEETAKLVAIKGLLKAYKSDTGTGDHIFMRAIRLDGVNNTTVAEVDALKNKLEEGDKI